MPNGHLSGARRASCMPGGYSLYTNFRERSKDELLRIPLGTCPKRGRSTLRAWIWAVYGDQNAVLEARQATIAGPSETFQTVSEGDSRNFAEPRPITYEHPGNGPGLCHSWGNFACGRSQELATSLSKSSIESALFSSTFSCLRSSIGSLLGIRTSLGLRSSVHRCPGIYPPPGNLSRSEPAKNRKPLPGSARSRILRPRRYFLCLG
jgi:hypothetical protein